MRKNGIKTHFVFDLDDTLIDGRQFCGETIAEAISKFVPDASRELIINMHEIIHGKAITDLYKEIIKTLKIPVDIKKTLPALLKIDNKIQVDGVSKIKIFEGVKEILEFLNSNNKKIHMCTNRPCTSLIPILKNTGIINYFETITSCLDEGHKKPDPKCLLEIIKKSKCKKREFIYFGDSETDCQFARNSGIDFIIFDQYLNEKNLFKKLINLFLENKINNK